MGLNHTGLKASTKLIDPEPRTEVVEKIKALEREILELKLSDKILQKASAYFGNLELDRHSNADPVLTTTSR